MPTQIFIIPPKSPQVHKPLGTSLSDKCRTERRSSQSEPQTPIGEQTKFSSDHKISKRIKPPELIFDNLSDWEDEDRRFGHRLTSIKRQRQKYKEPLPRIREDEPQNTTFSAIVSAPIVELPAGLILSNTIDYTTTSKREESTDLNEIQGQTLLHLAAKLGHEDIMRLLINETSQGNSLLNNRGQTPLLCAIESGSTSTATLLMEQNPLSLTCKDSIGSSAFHYATEQSNDIILSRAISLLKRLSSSAARLTVNFSFLFLILYIFFRHYNG
jgi:ankyrin repeat protein